MENLPKSIKLGILFIFASIASEIIGLYLYMFTDFESFGEPGFFMNLFWMGILANVFLVYNIYYRQNWARIILLVFYALQIIRYCTHISSFFFWELSIGIVSVIERLFQLSALVLLFSRASNNWFNFKNNLPDSSDI